MGAHEHPRSTHRQPNPPSTAVTPSTGKRGPATFLFSLLTTGVRNGPLQLTSQGKNFLGKRYESYAGAGNGVATSRAWVAPRQNGGDSAGLPAPIGTSWAFWVGFFGKRAAQQARKGDRVSTGLRAPGAPGSPGKAVVAERKQPHSARCGTRRRQCTPRGTTPALIGRPSAGRLDSPRPPI